MHEAPDLVVLPPALPETGRLHGLVDKLGDVLLQPDAPKDAQQLARRLRARLPRAGVKVPTIHAATLRRAVANCTDVSALLLHIGELTDTTPDDVARRVLEVTPRTPVPRRRKLTSADHISTSNPRSESTVNGNNDHSIVSKPIPDADPSPTPARSNTVQSKPQPKPKPQAAPTSKRGTTTTITTTATRPVRRTATTTSTITTTSRPARRTEPVTKRATGRKTRNGTSNPNQSVAKLKNDAVVITPARNKLRVQDTESTGVSIEPVKRKNNDDKIVSKLPDVLETVTPVRLQGETCKETAENSTSTVSTVRSLSFRSVSTGSENGTQTPSKSVLRARRGRENSLTANGDPAATPTTTATRDSLTVSAMAAVSSPMTPGVTGSGAATGTTIDLKTMETPPRASESVPTAAHRIEQILGAGKRPSVYARAIRSALGPAGYSITPEIGNRLMFETSRCTSLAEFIVYTAEQIGEEPIEVALACSAVIHEKASNTPNGRQSFRSTSTRSRHTNLSTWTKPQRRPSKFRATPYRPKSEPVVLPVKAPEPEPEPELKPEVEVAPVAESESVSQTNRASEEEEEDENVVETRQKLVYSEEQVQNNEQMQQEMEQWDQETEQVESLAVSNEYNEQSEYNQDEDVEYIQNEGKVYSQDLYTQQVDEYGENEFIQEENEQYTEDKYIQQEGEQYIEDEYGQIENVQLSQDGYMEQDGVFYTHSQVEYTQQSQPRDEKYYDEYDKVTPNTVEPEIEVEDEAYVEPYNPEDDVVEPVSDEAISEPNTLRRIKSEMNERITPEMAIRDTLELAKIIQSKSQPIIETQSRIRSLEDKILELQVAQRQVNIPTVCFTLGILTYCLIFYLMLYQL